MMLKAEGLGGNARDGGIEIQAYQVVAFQPGLEADMPVGGGAPPEAGEISLSLVGSNSANRWRAFEVGCPAVRQKVAGRGGGKWFPEEQGACRILGPGFHVGRQQRASHGTQCKPKTPECFGCSEIASPVMRQDKCPFSSQVRQKAPVFRGCLGCSGTKPRIPFHYTPGKSAFVWVCGGVVVSLGPFDV